ncbi:MAG: carbohydrate kinase family protein [Chthonomonadaceae bacterium]|nr:carbohydrate kinase family protein [Chthonomonadaceae bacterium]
MAEIVVAGHICLDVIPHFLRDAELRPGALIEVGAADLATGGCVPNVGRALHRLGVSVDLVGKIGDDPFGRVVAELLAAESPSLTRGLAATAGGVTSYSIVISPPGQDRTFLHMPGENDTFSASDLDDAHLEGAKVLHFGYPPLMARMYADEGGELESLLAKARRAGAAVSLDMSLPDPASPSGKAPWGRILERVLPLVDLFFPSDGELAFMLGRPAEECAERCLEMGAGIVVVKRGTRGLAAWTAGEDRLSTIPGLSNAASWANRTAEHPCFSVEAVGTTGAGDATIAGFLMGWVRGFGLEACLEAGCAVGACSVESRDAASGVRPWAETRARIDGGWN